MREQIYDDGAKKYKHQYTDTYIDTREDDGSKQYFGRNRFQTEKYEKKKK